MLTAAKMISNPIQYNPVQSSLVQSLLLAHAAHGSPEVMRNGYQAAQAQRQTWLLWNRGAELGAGASASAAAMTSLLWNAQTGECADPILYTPVLQLDWIGNPIQSNSI